MRDETMKRRFAVGMFVLLAAVAAGMSGCSDVGGAGRVPVTGNIKLDGKPLAGASVTFIGTGTTPSLGGVGITDQAGNFSVSHFRAGEGLEPGEYKVTVSKLVLSDGSPIPPGTLSIAELSTREMVPRRYNDFNNTMLQAKVKEGGEPIELGLASR